MQETNHKAKPFIKWVGGKGQLLKQLYMLLPSELYSNDFTYIEPFVGGGAMLFFMLQNFSNIKRVVINDINKNLIESYINVKENPDALIGRLKCLEKKYLTISKEEMQKEFYLEMRRTFNEEEMSSIDKTALFIFLNKTCFNGLYRENSKGKFNVPFGRYANPTICNEEVIYADSALLNKFDIQIMQGDFTGTISAIDNEGVNFFYFDPPYRPLSTTSYFNSYVKEAFNDNSQKALADFCRELSQRGNCLWMLSNSDCSAKNPQDRFFEDLYSGFDIQRVNALRSVNAVASKRGFLTELLIRSIKETHRVI